MTTSPGLLYVFLVCCFFLFLARNPWHWCYCFATARWVCIRSVWEYTIYINSKTIAVLSLSRRLQRGNIPLHQDVLCSSTDKEMHPFTLSLQVTKSLTNTLHHFKLLSLSFWHSPLPNLNKEICIWYGAREINDIYFLQSSKSLCDQQRNLCENRVPARRDPDGWDSQYLSNKLQNMWHCGWNLMFF